MDHWILGGDATSVAIIGGLFVATLLTLLSLPALYVVWFRIKEPRKEPQPGLGAGLPAVAQ